MKIRFRTLQDNLRATIWARVKRGEVTGQGLARRAGFQQAHLSNFLNGRRGLSLRAMDSLLDQLHIDVLDLAGVGELLPLPGDPVDQDIASEVVALVSLKDAADCANFDRDQVQDTVLFRKSLLRRFKPKTMGNRKDWVRFCTVEADAVSADGMGPFIQAGARLLVDRRYNWPSMRDTADPRLYLVRAGSRVLVRHVVVAPGLLILRARDERVRTEWVRVPQGHRHGDFIAGRICHLATEL